VEAASGPVKPFRLTLAANDDLFDIWSYVAPINLKAADRLENEIIQACERLADQPDLGHFRRDLTDKPVRFFLVHANYLVV
jgi:plasmid stabilization system protein ParE